MDAPVALADRPVHVVLSGLAAGDEVTVTAAAADYRRARWRGWANFRADDRGRVDLDRARPISGTYSGVDGMGLFWSMDPPTGDPAKDTFVPPLPDGQPAYQVRLSVTAHGRRLAQRTLTRQWLAAGVTRRTFTVRADTISGELFLPPRGTPRHPGLLVFGGSEGGNGDPYSGALLASHGYPALTLAYFRAPGLPPALRDIPLEYFARAARVLAAQPGVDPAHLVVRGYSRGTEAALLLGRYYPELIHGVIVYAPAAEVHGALARGTQSRHPVTGRMTDYGGSRPADAAARAQGWPKVLAFLAGLDR